MNIDTILSEVRKKRTQLRFVDREKEIERVVKLVEQGDKYVHIVYGPRGCGKTTLFKLLCETLRTAGDKILVVYTTLQPSELESTIRKLQQEYNLRELEYLIRELSSLDTLAKVLYYVGRLMWSLVEHLSRKEYNYFMLVLDEAYGLLNRSETNTLKMYVDNMYNIACELNDRLGVKSTFFFITSYSVVACELLPTRKCKLEFMWNLDRESTYELCEYLSVADRGLVYKLTGGNPREVENIARLGGEVERWLQEIVNNNILMIPGIRQAVRKWKSDFEQILEDIDRLDLIENERLRDMLLERNLVTRLPENSSAYMCGLKLEPNVQLGIGRIYAWEIPAYQYALEVLVEHPELTLEEIVRQVLDRV